MRILFALFRALSMSETAPFAVNLTLGQRNAILMRVKPRPRLRLRDRLFCVFLSRWFSGWQSWLAVVTPQIVIGSHRRWFKFFWRSKVGRPQSPKTDSAVCHCADLVSVGDFANHYPLTTMHVELQSICPVLPATYASGAPDTAQEHHDLHASALATAGSHCRWLDQQGAAGHDRVPAYRKSGA
jgi:hypothetical protein